MKNQKGITLVALIITIIVMLILVAVTLSIVLGDNGVIKKGREASQGTKDAYATENAVFSDEKIGTDIQSVANGDVHNLTIDTTGTTADEEPAS